MFFGWLDYWDIQAVDSLLDTKIKPELMIVLYQSLSGVCSSISRHLLPLPPPPPFFHPTPLSFPCRHLSLPSHKLGRSLATCYQCENSGNVSGCSTGDHSIRLEKCIQYQSPVLRPRVLVSPHPSIHLCPSASLSLPFPFPSCLPTSLPAFLPSCLPSFLPFPFPCSHRARARGDSLTVRLLLGASSLRGRVDWWLSRLWWSGVRDEVLVWSLTGNMGAVLVFELLMF